MLGLQRKDTPDGMKMMVRGNIFRKEAAYTYVQIHTHSFAHASTHCLPAPQEKSSEEQGVTGSRQKKDEPRHTVNTTSLVRLCCS